MCNARIVLCAACLNDGSKCLVCESTGGEIIKTQPIEEDDLDECAPPVGAA